MATEFYLTGPSANCPSRKTHQHPLTSHFSFITAASFPHPTSLLNQHFANEHSDILSKPLYDAVFLHVDFLILPAPFCSSSTEGGKFSF